MQKFLMVKLKAGVPLQRVICDLRSSRENYDFDQIHYIQKKDLHNILSDYSIGCNIKLHQDDYKSVHILLETLQKSEKSAILYY